MILTSTMEASVQQFASCFTKPSFQTFCVIVTGWLLGHGRRTVTRVLLAGDGLNRKTFPPLVRLRRITGSSARRGGRSMPSGGSSSKWC